MKNKILGIIHKSIPYIKELRPRCGSIAGCIIMQQLDFWFMTKPDGFYKFKSPCSNEKYKTGDSWCEEIGISDNEFTSSFAKIGIVFKSKGEFDEAKDKFKGAFYCSYFDRIKGLTWYFRNHEAVDFYLDNLMSVENQSKTKVRKTENVGFTETCKVGLQETQTSGLQETYKVGLEYKVTENTITKNTTEKEKKEKKLFSPSPTFEKTETSKQDIKTLDVSTIQDQTTVAAASSFKKQTNSIFRMIENKEELAKVAEQVIIANVESFKMFYESKGFKEKNAFHYAVDFAQYFFTKFPLCSLSDEKIKDQLCTWYFIFNNANEAIAKNKKVEDLGLTFAERQAKEAAAVQQAKPQATPNSHLSKFEQMVKEKNRLAFEESQK